MMRRIFSPFPRVCRLVAVLGVVCFLAMMPKASFAASGNLVVSPLDDDSPGAPSQSLPGETVPFFTQENRGGQDQPAPQEGITAGDLGTTASGETPMRLPEEPPSYKDGIVMAYLVELLRKQGKPCPSGIRLPVPPSLLFSEPLCRVAESVGKGEEFPSAFEAQGIYASHWRMFSATDQPAQKVANRLREEHCEALLEPHTHIGAWHSPAGWRIVLATLTDKPAAAPELITQPAATEGPAIPPAMPETPEPAQPMPPPAPVVPPVPADGSSAVRSTNTPASTPPSVSPTVAPDAAAAPRPDLPPLAEIHPEAASTPNTPKDLLTEQGASALFQLMNSLRAKGGMCSGKLVPSAPLLTVHPGLQAVAEKEVAAAAAKGSFGTALGDSSFGDGQIDYAGNSVSKMTALDRHSPELVLDVWKISPSRCETLLSSRYRDVGVAHKDGFWFVLLGQRGASPVEAQGGK